jgi:2-polyprenyl-3-methyl-5-hydroxy-6-metoxy-1,4-benzoquinol methylase
MFSMAANACLSIAAGLLRRDELRAATRYHWHRVALLGSDSDAGLDLWERRLYSDLLHPGERVLLVGSGAGRDLIALAEMGFDVTGIEPVPELVELTRHQLALRGTGGTVLNGFVETLNLTARYDVVLFSIGVYAFIPNSSTRIAMLARLTQHLSPGGRIVITCTQPIDRVPSAIWLARLSAWVSRSDWIPELGDNITRDHLGKRAVKYEHLFRQGEVVRECIAAGLQVVRDEAISSPFPMECVVAVGS